MNSQPGTKVKARKDEEEEETMIESKIRHRYRPVETMMDQDQVSLVAFSCAFVT
jgi:hypothetical protein